MHDRPTGYLSPAAEEALRRVSTATLTSQLLKRGLRNTFLAGLIPVRPELRMVGYAFTLRYIPMREDLTLLPPTRLTEVERAQRQVVECAMRLGSEGRITLPGGSSEKMV